MRAQVPAVSGSKNHIPNLSPQPPIAAVFPTEAYNYHEETAGADIRQLKIADQYAGPLTALASGTPAPLRAAAQPCWRLG